MRGMISAMFGVEGVRRAQERFSKEPGHDPRAGALGPEKVALDQKKLDALGFAGVAPVQHVPCRITGAAWGFHTWDGTSGSSRPDWLQADDQIIKPLVKASSEKYSAEKKLPKRTPGGLPGLGRWAAQTAWAHRPAPPPPRGHELPPPGGRAPGSLHPQRRGRC